MKRLKRTAARIAASRSELRTWWWLRLRLAWDARAFSLTPVGRDARGAGGLAWNEVESVMAFKRDLITTDLACLGFRGSGLYLEANEEMSGFEAFARELPTHLAGALPYETWFGEVLQPPLAENARVIFERAAR